MNSHTPSPIIGMAMNHQFWKKLLVAMRMRVLRGSVAFIVSKIFVTFGTTKTMRATRMPPPTTIMMAG